MSLALALRDARQTRRVERAQAQVERRYREAAGEAGTRAWSRSVLPVVLRLLGAALVPLFTWFGVHEDKRWSFVAVALVLVSGGRAFQSDALEFSAGEVLRHPSKAGVLLLRLCRRLPELLLTGTGWATAYVILLRDELALDPAGYVPLLLAVLLSPVAWTCGRLLCRLVAGGTRSLDPLVLATLAAAWIVFRIVFRSIDAPLIVDQIVGGVLAAGLAALWAFAQVRAWIRAPRRQLRVLGGELAILPRFLVAFLPFFPDPSMLRPIGWWALPFVLLVTLHALNRSSQAVRHAEERTSGSGDPEQEPRRDPRRDPRHGPIPVVLPPTHAGRRSLTRAALYLHRRLRWFRPGEITTPIQFLRCLPVILPLTLYHSWGVLLGAFAMLISSESELQVTVAILAGATAPTFVDKTLSFDLYRLGVDYVEQARHNLRSLVLAFLPTVLAAGVTGALAGWNDQRALVLAVIAAVFALRAGWRGFLGSEADGFDPRIVLAAIALLAASLWLPLATWWSAGAALALGLAGVFLRVRRWDERGLREAVRKHEEEPG